MQAQAQAILALSMMSALASADTGSFWFFTDAHLQAEYKEHSVAHRHCLEGHGTAGKYGSYIDCDMPEVTLRSSFAFMQEHEPAPDFILWTGDMASDKFTNYSREYAYSYQQKLASLFLEFFPDVTVIPVLGNHDTYPESKMPIGNQSFFSEIADIWDEILPDGARDSFVNGGFYSFLLTKTLRAIVLNTALYYNGDHLANTSNKDPAGQIAWLVQQLQEASNLGQRVLMAYHVPVGGWPIDPLIFKSPAGYQMPPCYNELLVDAFSGYHDIIVGHFAGHVHTDEFRFIKDGGKLGAESLLLLGPSLTEQRYTDPRLRLVYYDRQLPHTLLDYEQFRVSLRKANFRGRLDWYREYSWADAYGSPDLSATSARGVYRRLLGNSTLAKEYMGRVRGFDVTGTFCGSVATCSRAILCAIDSASMVDLQKC